MIASDDRAQRSFLHLLATVPRSLRAIWRLRLAVRAKRDPRGHEGLEGRFVPASAIYSVNQSQKSPSQSHPHQPGIEPTIARLTIHHSLRSVRFMAIALLFRKGATKKRIRTLSWE